jgi:hypothetical protein
MVGLACSRGELQRNDGGAGGGQLAGLAGGTGSGGDGAPAGAGGGPGGSTGDAGHSGSAGISGGGGVGGGVAGAAGARGPTVQVTYDVLLPQASIAWPMVGVDDQDTAVVVGPRVTSEIDPGPQVDWIPRQGPGHSAIFPNALTPSVLAVDPSGAVWLAGQLYRAVDFGGTTLQPVNDGYYLVRLNPDGSLAVARAVARPSLVTVYNATTDAQGNVYAVGEVYTAGSPPIASVFVTKFSPAGDELFNREFACQGTSAYAADVAVAPNGDLFIVGTYGYPLQIGSALLPLPSSSLGSAFVAALDPGTGEPRWATRIGGMTFDVGNAISVTSTGALRVAGMLSGQATVGGLLTRGTNDGSPFVAELTPTGAGNWVTIIDGTGIVFEADTNAADHTFAVGYVKQTATTNQTFVADVAGGVARLALRAPVSGQAGGAQFVAADRHGGAWVTGSFAGVIDFGLGPLDAGGADMLGNFLLHLEP